MALDLHTDHTADLYRLARAGSHCELVQRIDSAASVGFEAAALRVYGLLRTGDADLAVVHLAQLLERTRLTSDHALALSRWASFRRPWRKAIDQFAVPKHAFYRDWDYGRFWRSMLAEITGHELDFIAAVLSGDPEGFRVLVAIADAFKLRQEWDIALPIYLSMCRVDRTPDLLNNVFTLAAKVRPESIHALLQEFNAP